MSGGENNLRAKPRHSSHDRTNSDSEGHNTRGVRLGATAMRHVNGIRDRMKKIKQHHNVQAVQRRRAFFTSAAEEAALVEARYGPKSRMIALMAFLQSPRLQFLLTALLVFDVLIVVVELFLDAEFPPCNIITRDSVSCCGSGNETCSVFSAGRMLAAAGAAGQGPLSPSFFAGRMLAAGDPLCSYPLVEAPSLETACDPYKHTGVKTLQLTLFLITVFILSIYEVELFLLFCVLRKHFFKNKLYIIDTVVVSAALSLEVIVKFNRGNGDIAGVLTFARCWRFVRLGHGLVSSVHEAHSGHVEEMQQHVEGLMEHLSTLQERLEYLETQALQAAGGKALKKFGTKKRRNSLQARLAASATGVTASLGKLRKARASTRQGGGGGGGGGDDVPRLGGAAAEDDKQITPQRV